jgi:DNA polymerase elongation subunit (family B)
MGQVWTTRKGREQNLTVGAKGITFLDGMTTYKKTIWSEPDGGMSLSNISSIELDGDAAKLEIGDEAPDGVAGVDAINWAWKNDWGLFAKYVIRDVQATVGVDRSSGATDLYQDIRRFTGAQLDSCHNVYDTLDQYFIRKADERNLKLPTNEPVDVDSYYGAYVFDSDPSRHRNVIYFDVAALYPNIIYQLNASPETIIGTKDDLEESEYDESDCHWSYIDTRPWNVKKEDDPNYQKCYFLKPSVRKGFIPDVVEELLEMKAKYKGTDLYMAVKATVNGVYGIVGDANTYSNGFRLYDWRMAESVTLQGRKIIKAAAEWTTNYHPETYVTNGDTDGFGVSFGDEYTHEEVVEKALDTEKDMTAYLKQYCKDEFDIDESTIEMEAEKLMDPLFIPDDGEGGMVKKKYAYNMWWEQ